MAGPGGEREGRSPQEPHRIVTDDTTFEITIPKQGKRIHLSLAPDGTITTKVESLTQPEEQRLEAETQFTSIVRNLIVYSLEYDSAKIRPGSEEVGPELTVLDLEAQFKQGVTILSSLSFSNRQIQQMITGQGKQFTTGQERIGFMPSIVKEKVVRLNRLVDDYFIETARQRSQTKPQRRR